MQDINEIKNIFSTFLEKNRQAKHPSGIRC